MKIQSKEELTHALKFFDFIHERSGKVVLSSINSPETEWISLLAVFESALKHEQLVSKKIHVLFEKARNEKDFASESFLKWFIDEQVEEENSALKIIEKLKLIGDSKQGLLMLDKSLSMRK